jgi:hypothetical protein
MTAIAATAGVLRGQAGDDYSSESAEYIAAESSPHSTTSDPGNRSGSPAAKSSNTSPPTSAPEPSKTAGQPTTGAANPTQIAGAVSSFLETVAEATAVPRDDALELETELAGVATGPILLEIENQRQELEVNGWTISGEPSVVSVNVEDSDLRSSPATATVSACIDSTEVTTVDSSGEPLQTTAPAPRKRAINIYTLEFASGEWRVASRTFPDNPKC